MANSAGGLIIYGVKEYDEADKRNLPEKVDAVDQTEFSKEWLEQVINNIRPRIEGLAIYPVQIDSGHNDVVYVVEIPESTTAHQAKDYRYYKRFNFQSVPMDDYEVRLVMNRAATPDLFLTFSLERDFIELGHSADEEFSRPVVVNASISNASPTPASHYIVKLFIDKRLKVVVQGGFKENLDAKLSTDVTGIDMMSYFMNYSPSWAMPVWQGESFRISPSPFHVAVPRTEGNASYLMGWHVSCPMMQRKSGFAVLSVVDGYARIQAQEDLYSFTDI